jgi:hypothetical protein
MPSRAPTLKSAFAPFGHIEQWSALLPVERLVNELGRAGRITHFVGERQELYGIMNAVLCDDIHAGSLEPARRPDIPGLRIAFRHKLLRAQTAVAGRLGAAVPLFRLDRSASTRFCRDGQRRQSVRPVSRVCASRLHRREISPALPDRLS